MPYLREAPFCGLAQLHPVWMTTKLPENRRAFLREFVAPPPVRAVVVYPTSIALPKQRALPLVTCPRDNQKAYQDSLLRDPESVTPELFACNGQVALECRIAPFGFALRQSGNRIALWPSTIRQRRGGAGDRGAVR